MPTQRIETPDGISWHVETFPPTPPPTTTPEHIILIPSGEGDCGNLTPLATHLSLTTPYTILTFDMPGFSRTTAPPQLTVNVTPQLLATQISTLLTHLSIPRATFFGCSSGGGAVLALCALHPHLAKCGIVHEVPFDKGPHLIEMQTSYTDAQITTACENMFSSGLIEPSSVAKWTALGPEYHARLSKNYVTWIRGYVLAVEVQGRELASEPANLQRRPIFWTVGGLNEGAEKGEGVWKSNFELARNAGLEVEKGRLKSMHFPAVTVMEETAEWIVECVGKVKD